ncbi:MAG: PAS domain S-box protein, partial [Candidatus Hydrogenedentota bacterium]
RTMESIRDVVAEMDQEEERLLDIRQKEERSGVARLNAAIAISAVFALAILIFAARTIRNGFRLREQAEEALRASEENLAVTLRSIGDAVMTTDIAGRVTGLNAVAEKLTGWAEAEAKGHPVDEVFRIIDEETRRPAVVPVERVLATGDIQGLANHTVLIGRDGVERPIADSAAPIRDAEGQVRGVVLVFRDVTAERAAAADRDRFFSLSLDMLCVAKPDGYFKRVSPSFTQTLGWSVEEFLTRPFMDFVHPDDQSATLLEVEKQVTRGEKVLAFENRYQHKDGSWRLLSWTSVPYADGIMYGAARDVTEARAAEAELRTANETLADFKAALDELAIVATTDRRGKITYVNDKFCAISKYSREELMGQDHRIINSGHHPKAFIRDLWQTITSGRVWHGEIKNRAKDGEFYWVDTTIIPFLDEHGKPFQYIAIRADITERKLAEDRVTDLNLHLRRQAGQLELANKELESFSYSVSHDLRAPLRHIQGYGEMLAKAAQGQLSDKAERYLKIIVDTGGEMGSLIDELLGFSRMGQVEMREEKVSLDRLVQETIRGLEMATRGRNIVWKVAPLPPVLGDPSMIKQVFANLIGNALKYSSMRDPAEIEVGRDGSEAERVVVFVRDNGVGFDMQYAGKLFGVFQRLHRAEEFEGTGIGLANARRIVVRHGGRIWAEAELNKGATFYFTLKPLPSE